MSDDKPLTLLSSHDEVITLKERIAALVESAKESWDYQEDRNNRLQERIAALEKVAEIARAYARGYEQVDFSDVEDALRAAGYLKEQYHE